jgi:trypsin
MISQILALGILLQAGCRDATDSKQKIIGGEDIKNPGFFAGILHEGQDRPFCGASFISERVLVTAAHCIAYTNDRLAILPVVSEIGADGAVHIPVKAAVIHPLWDEETVTNDIALLFIDEDERLPEGITFAGYPEKPESLLPESLDLIGWGDISTHGQLQTDLLQGVKVNTVSFEDCHKIDGYDSVTSSQFCASVWSGGKDSCYGDSGGPAFSADGSGNTILQGLVSWGKACGQAGKPGVLTRIGSYSGWIAEAIAKGISQASSFASAASCYPRFTDTYGAVEAQNSITFDNHVRPNPWKIEGTSAFDPEAGLLINSCQATSNDQKLSLWREFDQRSYHANYLFYDEIGRYQIGAIVDKVVTYFCNDEAAYVFRSYGDERNGEFWINGEYKTAKLVESFDSGMLLSSCQIQGKKIDIYRNGSGQIVVTTNDGKRFWIIEDYLPPRSLDVSLIQTSDETTIRIHNTSDLDLFTWSITCQEKFHLVDKIGRNFQSEKSKNLWKLSFRHPSIQWATIRKDEAIEMMIYFTGPYLPATGKCSVNGINASVFGGESK